MRRKGAALRNGLQYNRSSTSNKPPPAQFQCENWSVFQVIEWLRGIDDNAAQYARLFKKARVDGPKLLCLEDSSLRRIGITKETARAKILQTINLLFSYSYSIKYENLQKIAVDVQTSVNNLLNSVAVATPIINNPQQSLRVLEVLNSVLRAVTEVDENVLKLIFWLDRTPFDDKKEFIAIRCEVSELIKEMLDCINNPNNPKFLSVPYILVNRGKSLSEICKKIVNMNDPLILYTAFLDRVILRKTTFSKWGFDVVSTCSGINLITHVDLDTPAGLSGKIDAGDEVIELNGIAVVGWSYSYLMLLMNKGVLNFQSEQTSSNFELEILLSKRPREDWTNIGSSIPKSKTYQNVGEVDPNGLNSTKMMLDFKRKIQPDLFARGQEDPLKMALCRSSSFSLTEKRFKKPCERCSMPVGRCVSLFVGSNKRPSFRRASVWNESPTAKLRSPFSGQSKESNAWLLLLASWGPNNGKQQKSAFDKSVEFSAINNRRSLTPRRKEPGIIIEEEDCYDSSDEHKRNIDPKSVIFSNIDLINENELDELKSSLSFTIFDPDWNAPIQDITGLQIARRSHLESGSSLSIIDSPLNIIQAKITKFFYGDSTPTISGSTPNTSTACTPGPSSSIAAEPSIWTSLTTSECRTPILKQSHETLFIPRNFSNNDDSGADSSSIESPSSCIAKIRTISSKGRSKLAPLAEPDEIGDLSNFSSSSVELPPDIEEQAVEQVSMGAKCDLGDLAAIPSNTHQYKTMDGWVRRQRLITDNFSISPPMKKHESKWIRSWMLLKDNILYIYANQNAKRADILIDVSYYSVTTVTDLKTSKRHLFALCWNLEMINFALYTSEDLKNWMEVLIPITRKSTDFDIINGKKSQIDTNRASAFYIRKGLAEELSGSNNGIFAPLSSPISPSSIASNLPSPRSFNPVRIFHKVSRQNSFCGFRPNILSTENLPSPNDNPAQHIRNTSID